MPRIEAIWKAAARACGFDVERTAAAYASTDGHGRILIGRDEILDADDAVAQLIFHELCHGLIQGPSRWSEPDWGLANTDARDVVAEHACLRVQVHLAAPHALRALMAPTTEYRPYHDAIGDAPLASKDDPAAALAAAALARPETRALAAVLSRALADTRGALDAGETTAPESPPDAPAGADASTTAADVAGGHVAVVDIVDAHPSGFAWGDARQSCGTCAWLYVGGRGPAVVRCRQAAGPDGNGARTERATRACARWEPPVDCQTCGACCREAYHSVTVSMRDPVVWKQPDLIERHGHRFEIRRAGDRCAALEDLRAAPVPGRPAFTCTIYEDRPRACRDFEAGGRHCLVARRRVGLSA